MIRIGFLGYHFKQWMGGINYYKNLLFAISNSGIGEIEPIVFVGKKTDPYLIETFEPHATIVRDSMFDRKSLKWCLSKVFSHILHSSYMFNRVFSSHGIDILSHANITITGLNCKTISWIPDFQHLHLPDMFPSHQIKHRDSAMKELLRKSDGVIVSSYDAYNDAKEFDPDSISRVHVLQFVSQPSDNAVIEKFGQNESVESRYQLPDRFFYLPNQIWKHKNHIQVFRAVRDLKRQGTPVSVICSGPMDDHRSPEHVENIKKFIKTTGLQNDIRLLGLIDYTDVQYLMRNSVAVINPSLFEGWSSTVEECKSIGKNMVLSDIPVHREQDPPGSVFFDVNDDTHLCAVLKDLWLSDRRVPDVELEDRARDELAERTNEFARSYLRIVKRVLDA